MQSTAKASKLTCSIAAILAFILIVTLIMPCMTVIASAAAPTGYTDIYADSTASVSITSSGSAKYFRFVPMYSGTYKFYSTDYTSDPYGALLDASGNALVTNDDGGTNYNFSITYDCVAGTVYYIKANLLSSSSTGSYTLHVETVSIDCEHSYVFQSTTAADCENDGVETYVCSLCGGSYTNTVETALGHDYVNGYCTRCGDADYSTISVVNVAVANKAYPIFNSGLTGTGTRYSSSANYDETSFSNGGYDLYGSYSSLKNIRLGLSFTMAANATERAQVTIYAYDVDEESGERDCVRLVDETTGVKTVLTNTAGKDYLSGQDSRWSTTTFEIPAELLVAGHTYHFENEETVSGWVVYVRTVDLQINGLDNTPVVPPVIQSGISYANLTGSISSDGTVHTSLDASAYAEEAYDLEYKATYLNSGDQKGSMTSSITVPTTVTSFENSFALESGAPRGTYEIAVFIRQNGTLILTKEFTASYGYSAVSYNENGGSNNKPTDTATYSSGDTVTVKFDYIPSLYGYNFLGWSTDRYATVPMYTEDGTNTFTIGSSDVTLYAVWEVAVCPHEWAETSSTEATCIAEGLTVYTCSLCGETSEVTIPELGHNYVNGVCSRCGAAEPGEDVWDGTIDTSWYNSTDTEFTLYTAEQLAGLAYLVNNGNTFSGKTIYLGNNIDLAGREWTPIGQMEETPFSGTFDGRYYVVSNLSLEKTANKNSQGMGFFGTIYCATVRNTGIENADIVVEGGRSGILCGVAKSNTLIEGCYTTGSISIVSNPRGGGGFGIGGFVGDMQGGAIRIRNCYTSSQANSTISDSYLFIGGLVGFVCGNGYEDNYIYGSNKYIENCYSDSTVVTPTSSKGGFVGELYAGTLYIDNCFDNSTVNGSYSKAFLGSIDYQYAPDKYITNSYYNASGSSSYGGTPTSADNFESQMWLADTLGWDFDTVWKFRVGSDYPVLQGFGNSTPTCHTASAWIYDVEPTCLTGGHRYNVCIICGEVLVSENVSPLQHDFAIVETVEATCTTDGYIVMECQRDGCSHTKTQVLVAPGHDFGDDNICDVCGFELVIHEHSYTETVVVPTCTQVGYTVYACDCGYEYRGNFVDQLGHSWNGGVVTVEKTCTTDGIMEYTCARCSASYEVTIPAGHNWRETVTVEATCTTDGSMTRECIDCGECETVVIPAAHAWDNGTVTVEPTCTEPGKKLCTCTVCGESAEIDVRELGHQFYNGRCIRCGEGIPGIVDPDPDHPEYGMYFEIDDIISNYGPEYINEYGVLLDYNDDAIIKKVAVFLTQEGNMWRRCIAVVGENITYATYVPYLSYDEQIYYTGLNSDWINIFRLSENSDGIWCYSNYATIGVNLEDNQGNLLLSLYDIGQAGAKTRIFDDLSEMIAWLKDEDGCIYHTEGTWTVETDATCGTDGLKYTNCTECGARIEQIIPATGAHVESGWIVDYDATCVTNGSRHIECTACGLIIQTEVILATGEHIASDWIVDAYPTATAPGSKHKECIVCYAVLETKTMAPLAVIKIEDIAAKAGSTVSVTVDIQNNPGIIGAVLTFDFDPSLTLVSATAGGAWSLLNMTSPANYNAPCTFVWDGVNSADYANGTIVTLTFEVPDTAAVGEVYNIFAWYSFGNMINDELENIDVSIEKGSITVEQLIGDVNMDGTVDVADVITLRRYLSSGYDVSIDIDQSDMNGDGTITVSDVILLRRYLLNGVI